MANRTIDTLPAAEGINDDDLFLLQQLGAAKKIEGAEFKEFVRQSGATVYMGSDEPRTEKVWIDTGAGQSSPALSARIEDDTLILEFASPDAVMKFRDSDTGGWKGVSQLGIPGDTGVGIESVEKTDSEGLVDTYTISLTNGEKYKFNVANGSGAVNSVNGKNGDVELAAGDIELHDGKTVQTLDDPLTSPNLHVVLIGDSYILGQYNSNGTYYNTNGWGEKLEDLASGATYHRFGAYRSGFVGNHAEQTFDDLLTVASNTIGNDRSKTALVVAGGGWNDKDVAESDLQQAVSDFCERAKEIFPNARIVISDMGGHLTVNNATVRDESLSISDALYRRDKIRRAYKDGAILNDCEAYVDNWEALYTRENLLSDDKVHPTEEGYVELAKWLLAYLRGNEYDPNYSHDFAAYANIKSNNQYFEQLFIRKGDTVHFSIITNPNVHAVGGVYFIVPPEMIPPKTVIFPCTIARQDTQCVYGSLSISGYTGDQGVARKASDNTTYYDDSGTAQYRLGSNWMDYDNKAYFICSGTYKI